MFRNKTFDLSLVIIPIIFLVVSVSVIYSLVLGTASEGLGLKQAIVGIVGLVILAAVSFLDYRFFRGTSWIFYSISIILLVLVDLFGKTANGAENWIDLKVFQLQPSEVAKIFLIFSLAAFFCEKIGKIRWRDIIKSFLMLALPLALILKEPDLGTGMVIVFIYLVFLFVSRPTKIQTSVILGVAVLLFSFVALSYLNIKPFGSAMKTYQRERITIFLHPEADPYGRGYNIKQAQITIGSGGILGRNLGKGSQSQLQFLPEAQTDFIFAGIAESFGFIGGFVLLALYCLLLIRLVDIANLARDNYGMLVAFGVAAMVFVQVLENVGMNLGLLPVTGIPLPFLSSGGTSLIVSLFSLGVVESIYIRHKQITF